MAQMVEGPAHDVCTAPAPILYAYGGDGGDGGSIIDDYPNHSGCVLIEARGNNSFHRWAISPTIGMPTTRDVYSASIKAVLVWFIRRPLAALI